ncbi:MAG: response regulator [Bacillales bacterium]|nr:response regulator [Bacillales bacterium]
MKKKNNFTLPLVIYITAVVFIFIATFIVTFVLGMDSFLLNSLYIFLPGFLVITAIVIVYYLLSKKRKAFYQRKIENLSRIYDVLVNGNKFVVLIDIKNNVVLLKTAKYDGDPSFVDKIKLTSNELTIEEFFKRYSDMFEIKELSNITKELLEEVYENGETEYRVVTVMKEKDRKFQSVQRIGLFYDKNNGDFFGVFSSRDISSSYEGFLDRMAYRREQINNSLVKLMQLSHDFIIEVSLKEDTWELFQNDYNKVTFENVANCKSYDQASQIVCNSLPEPFNKLLYDLINRETLLRNFEPNKLLVNGEFPINSMCTCWQEIRVIAIVISGSKYCYILSRDVTEQRNEQRKLEEINNRLEISLRNETQYFEALKSKAFLTFSVLLSQGQIVNGITYKKDNTDNEMVGLDSLRTCTDYNEFHKYFIPFLSESTKETYISKLNLEALREAYASGNKQVEGEFEFKFPNNKIRYLRTSVLLTKDISSNETYALIICYDISRQKEEENRQREILISALNEAKEASQSKTDFLSNISHDIRTPLNAIVGMTGIAKEHIDDRLKVKDALEKIETSTSHLLTLINEVLDLNRIESGKDRLDITDVNFLKFVEELRVMSFTQAETKNIHLTFLQKNIIYPNVIIDGNKLSNAVLNIINNAFKYTPSKGNVKVIVSQEFSHQKGRVILRFEVEDDGIGMSEKFQEKLFEPFEREANTTKSSIEGTGLGLAIAKTHIDLMNGNIECNSKIGKGTKFIITVDVKVSEAEIEEDKEIETKIIDITGLRILSVEDNFINREVISSMLKDKGAEVISLEDGTDFVEYMKTIKEGEIDLVLCDIQMPKMNGWDATKIVRLMDNPVCKKIPIIALSANAFKDDIEKSISVGMNDHISKPVMIDELLQKISKNL